VVADFQIIFSFYALLQTAYAHVLQTLLHFSVRAVCIGYIASLGLPCRL